MRVEDRGAIEGAARESRSQAAQKNQAAAGVTAGAAGWEAGTGSDQLQLSPLAGRIRGVFDKLAAQHAGRVAQVAAEVQAGRYQVDAGRLSRAVLAEAFAE